MNNNLGIITLPEVMAEMNSKDEMGQPKRFSVSFYTANLEKRTGGELIYLPKAVKVGVNNSDSKILIGLRPIDNPKYGHDITAHVPLIATFNGKKVP